MCFYERPVASTVSESRLHHHDDHDKLPKEEINVVTVTETLTYRSKKRGGTPFISLVHLSSLYHHEQLWTILPFFCSHDPFTNDTSSELASRICLSVPITGREEATNLCNSAEGQCHRTLVITFMRRQFVMQGGVNVYEEEMAEIFFLVNDCSSDTRFIVNLFSVSCQIHQLFRVRAT